MIGASSIRVINWAVRACCSGPKPGAMIVATSGLASSAATMARPVVTSSSRLATELASRQAARRRGSSSLARRAVKVGMKAEASAPPATR